MAVCLTRCELSSNIKLQPYGTPRRLRDQVTFRAAFIAVTAALQRERARAWSPLQSAWRTHRKSTLAGRPGAKDRALSTRMSEAQTEREAVAERGQGQGNAVSFKSWLHLFLQWHHTYRWIITHSNPALQITFYDTFYRHCKSAWLLPFKTCFQSHPSS